VIALAQREIVASFNHMTTKALVGKAVGGAALDRHVVTRRQKRVALAVAAVADLVQLGLFPLFVEGALSPLDGALDVIVALTLILVLGWRWRTALALAVELLPGLALFPTWTAVVATLRSADVEATAGDDRRKLPA
jgi:hypothetical protein